jgi:glyceraldehyde 3-phosphate dehydrogenase
MVPTSTGAAVAVTRALPQLEGKLDGMAIRVPVANVSCVDLVVRLNKSATVEEINAAMKAASEGPLKGVLGYTEDPIVSSDVMTQPYSSLFDSGITKVIGGNMVKILTWYDNEWGYSNRMVDALKYIDSTK